MLGGTRLRQWQLILEIASLGSVQRAADAIGMSQPTATHALSELERVLGFSLFERHAKGARLSPAGEAVLPKVRAAMRSFAESAEVMSDLLSGSQGELRVGAIEAGIGGLLGDAVARFTAEHPAMVINVTHQPPERLLQFLSDGRVDLVVSRRPLQLPADTTFEELQADRYVVVCSPRHALAGRQGVNRDQLAQHLWLTPPKATSAEHDFESLWHGTQPPQHLCWVESRALTLLLMMIDQRLALTMIPRNVVRPWLANGVLSEVPGNWGPPIAPVGALYATSEGARGPLHAFLAVLRQFGDLPLLPRTP